MNRLFKFLKLGTIIALLGLFVLPITAQDDVAEPSAPGEGGVIVQGNQSSDPTTFNPLLGNTTTSSEVYSLMYPGLMGIDIETGQFAPNQDGAVAESWEYDETGTILTINFRQDMVWSDGEQITVDDWIYSADVITTSAVGSPRQDAFYQLDDGSVLGGPIVEYRKIDDFTLELVIGAPETDSETDEAVLDEDGNPILTPICDVFVDINQWSLVPEHAWREAFGDDLASMQDDLYFVGPTFGPFNDPFTDFGVQVSLLADQNFTDTTALPYVAASEWQYLIYADSTVGYQRFLAGDFSFFGIPAADQNDFRLMADESGDFNYFESAENGYGWIALNTADPTNPQAAFDENGERIEQGLHPIFGDVLVRQAVAHGIDLDSVIGTAPTADSSATGIYEGAATRVAVHDHPVFSVTRDLYTEAGVVPRAFDQELAASLLEEAGWTDSDDDGVRECNGCLYSTEIDSSFEGSPLEFELNNNTGAVLGAQFMETAKIQLEEIGFVVNYNAVDFGTLVGELTGQTFDAVFLSINMGLPFNPGSSLQTWFGVGGERPGGFAVTSWYDPEFQGILDEMQSIPGCDPDTRNQAYAEAQSILWEAAPWVFLWADNEMFAAPTSLANYDPILPGFDRWNIDDWHIVE